MVSFKDIRRQLLLSLLMAPIAGLLAFATPRLLIAAGVPLDRWIATAGTFMSGFNISHDVAVWGATTVLALALYLTALWLIWNHSRRPTWSAGDGLALARSIKNEVDKSGEPNPVPDMTIHDLFFHIRPDLLENAETEKRWESVAREVMDKFSTGQMNAWGREIDPNLNIAGALVSIPNTYWRNRVFIFHFLDKDKGIGKLAGKEMAHTYSWQEPKGLQYADLQVNHRQVFQIWPQSFKQVGINILIPEPPRGAAPAGIRTPPKPQLPTWYELEQRFKDLEPALQYSRIDGQTGAAGEHWRIAGGGGRDTETRFNAVAALASKRLFQDFPDTVSEHGELAKEKDPIIRWYKALQYIGRRYTDVRYAEQTNDDGSSGGFIYMGTIDKPASASATLCLEFAAPASQGVSPSAYHPDLLFGDWVMNFNPAQGGEKPITFLDGGEIGEGRNHNEHRWAMSDDVLEIRRANGDLQNRFRYDHSGDRFNYLADVSAKGLKDQFIYRPKSLQSG